MRRVLITAIAPVQVNLFVTPRVIVILAKMFIRKTQTGTAANVLPHVRQISRFRITINVLNAERMKIVIKKATGSIIGAIQTRITAHVKHALMVGMQRTGAESVNARVMMIAGRESIAIYNPDLVALENFNTKNLGLEAVTELKVNAERQKVILTRQEVQAVNTLYQQGI